MQGNVRVIISGGGTGGHIYPAIAIANELKHRYPNSEILFVGASDKMEMQKVPQAGYDIEGLWISGIQRSLSFENLKFPIKLVSSLVKSRKIIRAFKPDLVVGTGGFASGAVVKVAASMGIPTVIQEQNSYPGITNKLLGSKAKIICVAYDGLERFFPKHKLVKTGNPVRQDLLNIQTKAPKALSAFNLIESDKTLLVLGGSLGSRRINQLVESHLDFFKTLGVKVIWQCGSYYYQEYKKHHCEQVQVLAFIDRMDYAYAASDFIISRAGASSVSELAIVGKPVLFIPSPNVSEDHQKKNAMQVVANAGAVMIEEKNLEQDFIRVFEDLYSNELKCKELSASIKKMALPDATKDIVDQIVSLLK